jgi:hypothetical protein
MEHRWQYEARDSGESRGELEGLIDEEEEEEWEIARHYHIQVLIEGADVLPITVPIQTIDRPRERVEEVGLQTAEAKSILRKLQQIVVQDGEWSIPGAGRLPIRLSSRLVSSDVIDSSTPPSIRDGPGHSGTRFQHPEWTTLHLHQQHAASARRLACLSG